jgi:hypothetical protein
MTHGLVKAALASQDLTIGKEVQKMFIPLDTDDLGRKLTSGYQDTPFAQFFGYYEGAKVFRGTISITSRSKATITQSLNAMLQAKVFRPP